MAQKYLTDFYTFKVKTVGARPIFSDPSTPLEQQIYVNVLSGNQQYYARKFTSALSKYLSAWALLPKTFYPAWVDNAGVLSAEALLPINMTPQLASASVRLLQMRDVMGAGAAIAPVVNPPEGLVELNAKFAGPNFRWIEAYQTSLTYLQSGSLKEARSKAEELLRAVSTDEVGAQADAMTLLGAVAEAEGNHGEAQERLASAQDYYRRTGQPGGVAAMQLNTAVVLTRSGRAEDAGKLFATAAANAPRTFGWSVTHSSNPGVSAISRTFGEAGLPFLVRGVDGAWTDVGAAGPALPKHSATVLMNSGTVQLNLDAGSGEIVSKLLQPRINAVQLGQLETYYWQLPQFVSYLTHVAGFILPIAIGDTYAALGDGVKAVQFYLKSRDYEFLNLTIERPMLWRKIARTLIRRGNRLYRDRDMVGARAEYEKVLRILPGGGFELTGALYSGAFAPYAAEHLAFLNAGDRQAFNSIEYSRRALILEAFNGLSRILQNINYLGFPEDIVPIHSWRYLQNVARYFANHAMQAERAYITFKDTAEKEEFTKLALEQAVDSQAAALEVEKQRIKAAKEQLEAARLARQQAQIRLDNAKEQRAQYAALSAKLAAIEEIIAFTNATGLSSDIVINQDWAGALGITSGTYDPAILVQLLTRARSKLTKEYELANLDRQIEEMQAGLAVAEQQVQVAEAMLAIAEAQLELAKLKLAQAEAQLQHFDAQEFTPELWDNLAEAQRDISQQYLDWAISAAFLLERAFEFDYDTEVNRIRFDYERSELNGLLAADYLLVDIDSFTFDRIMETEKQVPVKITISLADRYPSQYRDFQKTGRIDFEVLLQDVDQLHPGTCVRKLKRVEVVVEGLIGPRGLHGTLTNSGISHDRARNGSRKTRLQKPETMALSQFELRNDGFVFTSDEELLALFENAGPAGGWILEFPPESNDVDYRAITNIHLVLYFDAFYSELAADHVRAELAATAVFQATAGLSLRHQYPDEFFALRDTGNVSFAMDNAYLPYNHADPRIREVYMVFETGLGVSHADLVVNVSSANGGGNATQTTDASGMINSGTAAEPLNVFRGLSLNDTWSIDIDEAANAAAFAAGFAWDKVSNIFLFVDYEYTPRGMAAIGSDFAADPMADFDVTDDPAALTGGPSAWAWDGPNQRISQTSNIHHPAGNANVNTSPDKPGTYLVRKTDNTWPALANLVARSHVNSGDNDGIGLVFRYQDVDNFYFFLMDAQRNYRRIGKKVNGVFQDLDTSAVDVAQGFPVNQDLEVAVAASGQAFKVYLNGQEILSGSDMSIPGAGQVGFYSWGNQAAHFGDLHILEI